MPRLRIQRFDLIRYGWVLAVIVVFGVVYGSSCQRIPVLALVGAEAAEPAWVLTSEPGAGSEAVQVRLTLTLVNPTDSLSATVRSVAPALAVNGQPVLGAWVSAFRSTSAGPGERAALTLTVALPLPGLPEGARTALEAGGTTALSGSVEMEVAVSTVVDSQTLTLPPLTLGPLPPRDGAQAP
jgi:hypothetical protein